MDTQIKLILRVSGWHGKNRNRIKLSKGYFYHKAQNSWEVKKNPKICNTSLPFYSSKRIRNPPELRLQLADMLSSAMTPAQDVPILPLPSNCFQACLHSTLPVRYARTAKEVTKKWKQAIRNDRGNIFNEYYCQENYI